MKIHITFACLIPALLAAAPSLAAQWFAVEGPRQETARTRVEVDLTTLRPRTHSGEGVIRVSYDAAQAHEHGFGYRSFVGTAQFDCQRRTIALSSAAYYALPRGQGDRVGADSAGRESGMPAALLRSIPVETQQALLRATCAMTQPTSSRGGPGATG